MKEVYVATLFFFHFYTSNREQDNYPVVKRDFPIFSD